MANPLEKPVKKTSQHHVWQHYLRTWSKDDQVCCLQEGRIFSTGIPVLGVGNDFYKVEALTDDDLNLLHLISGLEQSHPIAREHHDTVLRNVLTPMLFVKENRGKLNNLTLVDEYLDSYNTNVVDNYHTNSENKFAPLLDRALQGDTSWYDNGPDCIAFCAFVGGQVMRTRGVKERTVARLKERMGLDASRIWNILALIYGFNIGCALYMERKTRRLVAIRNDSETPFITGDQPAMNLMASGDSPPDTLSLYFPISPRIALYMGEPGETSDIPFKAMTAEAASALNRRVVQASHRQVYAQSRETLEAVNAPCPASPSLSAL